jgi:hypothetical protein
MKPALILFVSINLLFAMTLQGQILSDTLPTSADKDSAFINPFVSRPGLMPAHPDKKVSFGMEMGSAFGFSSGNGSLFGVYVSPSIRYKVSPKFNINFGATISNSNFINYINPFDFENTARFNNNITQTFLYAEGQYMMNNRLMINAKGYKEIYRFDEPKINPRALDLNGGGVAFGFQYKVTDNFHFGAQIGIRKGTTPYSHYQSGLFSQPGFGSYRIIPTNGLDPW